jgi:hypothetical protein
MRRYALALLVAILLGTTLAPVVVFLFFGFGVLWYLRPLGTEDLWRNGK